MTSIDVGVPIIEIVAEGLRGQKGDTGEPGVTDEEFNAGLEDVQESREVAEAAAAQANTSKNAAAASATSSQGSATTAAGSASLASTKAAQASASAADALGSATSASNSATVSTTKAGEAASSATASAASAASSATGATAAAAAAEAAANAAELAEQVGASSDAQTAYNIENGTETPAALAEQAIARDVPTRHAPSLGMFFPEVEGADPTGVGDSYAAFQSLATVVNAAGGGNVVLRDGATYRLGQHVVSGNGIADIEFNGCSGLSIVGSAKIDVQGNFDRAASTTRAIQPIRLVGCTNVTLAEFEVDGNVDQMTNSSLSSEPASQLVALFGCIKVAMKNLWLHHGSCDGIYISKTGTAASRDVVTDKVRCEKNARNGMSVIYLWGGKFDNSRFNDTGQSTGTYGVHAPGAGVDIEPNATAASLGVDTDTGMITFNNCEFSNNNGQQFVASLSDRISNVTLRNCTADGGASTSATSVVTLSVNGGLIEGGSVISRLATSPPILPGATATGAVIRTVVRGVRIVGVDRSINVAINPISLLVEDCSITFTGVAPPATAGRMLWVSVAVTPTTVKFRNCSIFFPAAMYGGSGANYTAANFGAAFLDRVSFETDLVPTTTEHFDVGIGSATVSNCWFTNLGGGSTGPTSTPVRPVSGSLHDPAFPFGRGDAAPGNKVWIGRTNNGTGSAVSLSSSTVAPTTGTWKKGEIVWNTAPSTSAPLGWTCITAGTPGTWLAFYPQLPTTTTAALVAIGNAVNTADKYAGKMLFNTTTNKPVWAVGSTAGSVWNDATGAAAHTPV